MGKQALELLPLVNNPINDIDFEWNKLQLFSTKRYVYLIYEGNLYTLDGSWAKTILVYDFLNSHFDIIDHDKYVLFNTIDKMYERDPDTGVISEISASDTMPKCNSICDFNGQIFGVGVTSGWNSCEETFACWGNIGEINFSIDQKNESGFADLGVGRLLRCLSDKSGVICYGEEGVVKLIPVGQSSFFGQKFLSKNGIAYSAMAFGDVVQYYIDHNSKLYIIEKETVIELGYEEFLSNLDLSITIVSKDMLNEDYYICDGNYCYVLSQGMLFESSKKYSGLVAIDGNLYSCYASNSDPIILTSDDQDNYLVGMKGVEFIELGISTDGITYCRIIAQYDTGKNIFTSSWSRVNDSGYAYVGVCGNVYRVEIKIENATRLDLRHITFNLKLPDNRIQNQLQTISERNWNAGQINE